MDATVVFKGADGVVHVLGLRVLPEEGIIECRAGLLHRAQRNSSMPEARSPSPMSQSAWSAVWFLRNCLMRDPNTSDIDSFRVQID